MFADTFKRWHSRTFVRSYIVALLLSALFVPSLFSQTAATGALTGTVKDSSGAVVPNATVTATNIGTNQARTTTADADGIYKFGFMPPGTYKVRFEASGFNTVEVPSVTILVTETPVPVIPMAIAGLWGSIFSRRTPRLLQRLPRRLWHRVVVNVGEPVPPGNAVPAVLRERVRALYDAAFTPRRKRAVSKTRRIR